jgi:hypothetical protein
MTSPHSLSGFSNEALLAETVRLAGRERAATAELIAALAEVDARRLYLGEGCSSILPTARACCTCRSMPRMARSRPRGPHSGFLSFSTGLLTDR